MLKTVTTSEHDSWETQESQQIWDKQTIEDTYLTPKLVECVVRNALHVALAVANTCTYRDFIL